MLPLTIQQCEDLLFESYARALPNLRGYDQHTRDLDPMRRLYDSAALDSRFAPSIIVTGSKGKGSTAILTAALLQGMGHRVGLLTSPHLITLRERIRVDGHAIMPDAFTRIVNRLAPFIRASIDALPPHKYLSPTGLFLAVALEHFKAQGVTAMVLEVGRGGRYDDVNIVENRVACFTPIMGEHLDKIGPTVVDVAWHKAGIIKPRSIAVSVPQTPDVLNVLRGECEAQDAELQLVGQDVLYDADGAAVAVMRTPTQHAVRLTLHTPARYQALNLALSYGAATALDAAGTVKPNIGQAVAAVRLPGRCDVISELPRVIIDGAINRQSAEQFAASAKDISSAPIILVTALPSDKDAEGLLETLIPHAAHTIITRVSASHLHFDDRVSRIARGLSSQVSDETDVFAAFTLAIDLAGAHGTVWVVGTQSLVRDAMVHWHQNLDDLYASDEDAR